MSWYFYEGIGHATVLQFGKLFVDLLTLNLQTSFCCVNGKRTCVCSRNGNAFNFIFVIFIIFLIYIVVACNKYKRCDYCNYGNTKYSELCSLQQQLKSSTYCRVMIILVCPIIVQVLKLFMRCKSCSFWDYCYCIISYIITHFWKIEYRNDVRKSGSFILTKFCGYRSKTSIDKRTPISIAHTTFYGIQLKIGWVIIFVISLLEYLKIARHKCTNNIQFYTQISQKINLSCALFTFCKEKIITKNENSHTHKSRRNHVSFFDIIPYFW